jgi:chromosome partitioning protein
MPSLVIASQKGGVGKTTLALNLAYAFAELHLRTLLIDTDPQGAIGLSLSKKLSEQSGFAEVIAGQISPSEAITRTRMQGLSIMPVGRIVPTEVDGFGGVLADGRRYASLLQSVAHDVDITILDTPCGFGGITTGALRACTHVLAPIQAEPVAVRSSLQLIEAVRAVQREGRPVQLAGFVLTMLQNHDPRSAGLAREVWDMFPRELLFEASTPRDPVFLEASNAGVPVALLRRPPPPVTHIFSLLATELAQRMRLGREGGSNEPERLVD